MRVPTAPAHAADWMWEHRRFLSTYPINDLLWLPGSHDAGMGVITSTTFHATADNTRTQILTIEQQLLHGIRWFDVRPMMAPDRSWWCSHFGDTGVGWQGATGQKADEVIDDVNRFTQNHKELVVLRLTHVQHTYDSQPADHDGQRFILQLFVSKLNHVWCDTTRNLDCLDSRLTDFLPDNSAHGWVIISTKNVDGPEIMDGIWAEVDHFPEREQVRMENQSNSSQQKALPVLHRTDWNVSPTSVTKELNTLEGIWSSTIFAVLDGALTGGRVRIEGDPRNVSILNVARDLQRAELQFQPQRLFNTSSGGVFQIDNIQDDTAMTMCLATSYMRYWCKRAWEGHDPESYVIVYGGKIVQNVNVEANIKRAFQNHQKFLVNDETMGVGDLWPGSPKSCVVYFRTGDRGGEPFFLGRYARQGEYLDFCTDVDMAFFHNFHLRGGSFREVTYQLWRAITLKGHPKISMDLGIPASDDPWRGHQKSLTIRYRTPQGPNEVNPTQYKERMGMEGIEMDFAVDIDWVKYHGIVIGSSPETYKGFFRRFDAGERLTVSNGLMGVPNHMPDPDPGNRKQADMKYTFNGGKKWDTISGWEHDEWNFITPQQDMQAQANARDDLDWRSQQ